MTLAKKTESFLALQDGGLQVLMENLDAYRRLHPWEVDKAVLSSGNSGNASWVVPTLDEEEPGSAKSLEGIILHFRPDRRYYTAGLSEGGVAGPPDCYSLNGIEGFGDPGGVCEVCPMNQWGSGRNGGKACPEYRLVYLLQPQSYMPLMVQIPTTSVRPFNQYLMRLAARGSPYYAVVTSLSLVKAQQKTGSISYGQLVAKKVRDLNDEEARAVRELALRFKQVPVSSSQPLNG